MNAVCEPLHGKWTCNHTSKSWNEEDTKKHSAYSRISSEIGMWNFVSMSHCGHRNNRPSHGIAAAFDGGCIIWFITCFLEQRNNRSNCDRCYTRRPLEQWDGLARKRQEDTPLPIAYASRPRPQKITGICYHKRKDKMPMVQHVIRRCESVVTWSTGPTYSSVSWFSSDIWSS